MFRSVRTWKQDGSAERFLELLNLYGPWIFFRSSMPTTFIEGNPVYSHVSSTVVRNCVSDDDMNGDTSLDRLVHCPDLIRKFYGPKKVEDKKDT